MCSGCQVYEMPEFPRFFLPPIFLLFMEQRQSWSWNSWKAWYQWPQRHYAPFFPHQQVWLQLERRNVELVPEVFRCIVEFMCCTMLHVTWIPHESHMNPTISWYNTVKQGNCILYHVTCSSMFHTEVASTGRDYPWRCQAGSSFEVASSSFIEERKGFLYFWVQVLAANQYIGGIGALVFSSRLRTWQELCTWRKWALTKERVLSFHPMSFHCHSGLPNKWPQVRLFLEPFGDFPSIKIECPAHENSLKWQHEVGHVNILILLLKTNFTGSGDPTVLDSCGRDDCSKFLAWPLVRFCRQGGPRWIHQLWGRLSLSLSLCTIHFFYISLAGSTDR